MKKFHIIIVFLVALCFSSSLQAKQLSVNQAVKRAKLVKTSALKSATRMKLLKTVTDDKGHNLYYICSNPLSGKLYFLSADDCARPLLGYSDQPFDFANDSFPEPLNELLDCYSREIAYGIEHPDSVKPYNVFGDKKSRLKSFETEFPSIPAMMPYEWGTIPFNSKCPLVDSVRTKCGCVACAMYQVMAYHQYPATGRDTVMYATTLGGKDTTLMLDLNGDVYNWSALSDLTSDEGIEAAGVIGRACAYSVHATFGVDNTSARTSRVAPALVRYFNYDSSMVCIGRSDDDEMWFRILYNELENNRPVVYAASGTYGHAFVCDGFNASDTTFHFSWDWYGKLNGYYSLQALNPGPDQFNEDNIMVIGIQPPKTYVAGTPHVFAYGDLEINPYIVSRDGCQTVAALNPSTTNTGYASEGIFFAPPVYSTAQVGVKFTNNLTKENVMMTVDYGSMVKASLAVYDYALFIPFNLAALSTDYQFLSSDYTYTVSLYYRDFPTDSWQPVSFPDGCSSTVQLKLCDNGMFTSPSDEVLPMLQTNWKEAWINFYCPKWLNGNRCGAGYDATALGQINYALKAPSRVFGSIHYDQIQLDTLNYNFQLLEDHPEYDVHYIGKVIRTKYDRKSTIHSPAAMVYGLHNNMGLANCQFAARRFYTTNDWISMLDDQLAKGNPVYYCGYKVTCTDSVRRAFVVDGYNVNHSYHINFGDGGEGDKYTDLNVINYSGSTPGNTDDCFPYGQGMLLDFFTECSVDSVNLPKHPFMLMSPLVVNNDSTLTTLALDYGNEMSLTFHLADCTAFDSAYTSAGTYNVAVGIYNSGSLKKVVGSTAFPLSLTSGTLTFSLPNLMASGNPYEMAIMTSIDSGATWERAYNYAPNSLPFTPKWKGTSTISIPFNPSFGADLSLYSDMEVVTDTAKGVMAHLPLANYTEANYEDVLRLVVKSADGDSVFYACQPVAVYGTTNVVYDIVLPDELKAALAGGGQLLGYYYKVGEGWLPLQTATSNKLVPNTPVAANAPVCIYSSAGLCLKRFSAYSSSVDSYLDTLPKGVYVVSCGSDSHKVVVK